MYLEGMSVAKEGTGALSSLENSMFTLGKSTVGIEEIYWEIGYPRESINESIRKLYVWP